MVEVHGIACEECAQGLCAVFGISRCKKCTNYWLLLLPAFAIAGLFLVLFVFNLTVVDGDINGFISIVSGLSIHSSRIFPSTYVWCSLGASIAMQLGSRF